MLSILNNIDPKLAQGILASLALGMIPDPGIEQPSFVPSVDFDREQLLRDLRARLHLKRDDNSPRAMSKLYGALAEEMKRLSLQGKDLDTVKVRLGQQGSLSPAEYQVIFSPEFRETAEACGISESTAESVVRRPDSYEHFVPEHAGFDPDNSISLFLRVQKETRHSERYIILVFTRRKGYVQDVRSAWRVYPSDVDLSQSISPRDVLTAFVDVFGANITIGEKTGKLLLNERLPIKRSEGGPYFEILQSVDPTVELGYFFGSGKFDKESGVVESVIAFSIDYGKYAEALNRHGLRLNVEKMKARINRKANP
jgi:hypothetical protein